jgi:8-oxo-dGTP diphosphatase
LSRHTRYQGLIIKDHQILLIMHREHASGRAYWVIPGGGLEPDETEQECVIREMIEETNLDVAIERLLFDEPILAGKGYAWRKSYLCHPVSGIAAPGFEPEQEAANRYAITEVSWFNLLDESDWPDELYADPFTYPQLVRLREELGWVSALEQM